jgi:hypothetical protein
MAIYFVLYLRDQVAAHPRVIARHLFLSAALTCQHKYNLVIVYPRALQAPSVWKCLYIHIL